MEQISIIGNRIIGTYVGSYYFGLENHFKAFKEDWTKEQIQEAYDIIDVIFSVDSLRKKAFVNIKNGEYIPRAVIKTALRIRNQIKK